MGYFQTWLLYHNALSSGVEIEDILKFARRTKERASDDSGVVIELRSQVAEQQKIINQIILERDSKQVVVTTAATSKISPTILNGKIKNNNSITNTGVVNSNLQPLLVASSKATKRDYGALDASNTATFNSNRSLDIANNSTKDDVASDIMVGTVTIISCMPSNNCCEGDLISYIYIFIYIHLINVLLATSGITRERHHEHPVPA